MHVITEAGAPRFALPGVTFTALASPSRGASEVCTWRLTVAPNLRSDQSHTLDRDEIFMVASGAIQLAAGSAVLRAGDAAVVPAGTPIELSNPDDEPAEVFVVIQAGFTGVMADGTVVDTPPWAQ
jgi:mannose-6-phosphate isomerase-like protein (cupin superfamily)